MSKRLQPVTRTRRQRRARRDVAWQSQALRPISDCGPYNTARPLDLTQQDWWAGAIAVHAAQSPSEPIDDPPDGDNLAVLANEQMRETFAQTLVKLHQQGITITEGRTVKFHFALGTDQYEVWLRETTPEDAT